MIELTELRYGNWYYDVNKIPKKVTGLEITYDSIGWISPYVIEPIPLTREILEAAGFVEAEVYENVYSVGLPLYEKSDELDMLYYHFSENIFELTDNDYHIKLPHIKYLHQLQNFYFALTGEELNVNLPSHAVK